MRKTFTVQCVAEIDSHIGQCTAYCVGDSPSDYYVEYIENKYHGHKDAEHISDGVMREIDVAVAEYFGCLAEAQAEAREDR